MHRDGFAHLEVPVSTKALIIIGLVSFVLLNASLMGLYLLMGAAAPDANADELPVNSTLPSFSLTSDKGTTIDNAAMIGAQGYYEYLAGHMAGMDLNGIASLPIDA